MPFRKDMVMWAARCLSGEDDAIRAGKNERR
jgi:hypothetical protein